MGCEDAPEMDRDETAPTDEDQSPLRLAGFLTSVLGGALVCIGALLPWVRTGLEGLPDEFSPSYYGIDLPDGLVVLALGVVMLVCLGVTRVSSGGRSARVAAGALLAASFLTIAIAGASLATAPARFEGDAVDDVLAELGAEGTATGAQRAQVEQLMDVRLAPGPFVALGGGMLGVLGGVLVLSWARRASAPPAIEADKMDESTPTEM